MLAVPQNLSGLFGEEENLCLSRELSNGFLVVKPITQSLYRLRYPWLLQYSFNNNNNNNNNNHIVESTSTNWQNYPQQQTRRYNPW